MTDFVQPVFDTRKVFLDNSYVFSIAANIVHYEKTTVATEGSSGAAGTLILDATCFYPQGGGQPTDEGTIIALGETFTVVKVTTDAQGQILHTGTGTDAFWTALGECCPSATDPSCSIEATLNINEKLRRIYTRLHSTGHVLDAAMGLVGFGQDRLVGTKGYHFLDGPFVEYVLVAGRDALSATEVASLPTKLTEELRKLVEANTVTEIEDMSREDAQEVCGKGADLTHYPATVRMVKMCGLSIPCGGTHINATGEIGAEVEVTRIKKKKNTYKVSYTISAQ